MRWSVLFAVVAVIFSFMLIRIGTNNVCTTFTDYYSNRDGNENCYYNPDYDLQVPDIVRRNGYPLEVYNVTTKDGYILTVFRIPNGKLLEGKPEKSIKEKPRKPVFLQHGITLNAGAFLTTGKKSLGFILADAGYDVWLGNFRGTMYSRNHTTLEDSESEFWEFSFHELGVYDLPAQLDLVSKVAQQKIIYIGFSMGTTAAYVYASTYPESAYKKIEIFVNLAPIVFMRNMGLASYLTYVWPIVKPPLQLLTKGKLYPRPPMPNFIFRYLCLPLPIQMEICQIPDMIVFGINYSQNDPETLPVTLQYNKDTTSIKTISHYYQLVLSGNFEQYDYGKEENEKRYGSAEPPHYNLTNITVPNYLVAAPNDQLSTKENVVLLHELLPQQAKPHDIFFVDNDNFNHIDVITGKDAVSLVYDPIIGFLENWSKNSVDIKKDA